MARSASRSLWFALVVAAILIGLLYRAHLRRHQREESQIYELTQGARKKAAGTAAVTDEAAQQTPVVVGSESCKLLGLGGAPRPPEAAPDQAGQKEAQGLVAQALALQAKGQMAESLPLLDDALARDATSAEAYFARGQARSRGTEFKAAEQDLLTALALKPSYPEALDNLTVLYMRAACMEHAAAAAQRLIEQNPSFHPERAYYLRASARQKLGDLRGALDDAEHACQLGNQEACDSRKAYTH